jgi:hypothetical protein
MSILCSSFGNPPYSIKNFCKQFVIPSTLCEYFFKFQVIHIFGSVAQKHRASN